MVLMQLPEPVSLSIPSDPAALSLVRALVERLTLAMGFPSEERERMVLAVDEACSNVIRYAYGLSQGGRILISFRVEPALLEIQIRDFGISSDPEGFIPRNLDEIRPGGLGTHFIRSAMDVVRYETPLDGGTLLTMIKHRKAV